MKCQKVAITHLATGIATQVTHHVIAMDKIAKQHILTKYSECNAFQVISDIVHDFMSLIHLKLINKFIRRIIMYYY